MVNRTERMQGPAVLVGEAVEDWTGDAVFYEYSVAADPIDTGAIGRVPIQRFSPSLHHDGPSRMIPLDLSTALGVHYPATSPALLASFVVIHPGDELVTHPDATSELYYCLEGQGRSEFRRTPSPGATGRPVGARAGRMEWGRGDFLTFPAGCTIVHTSGASGRALLYRVTDAPLLHYLGVTASEGRFEPTRFDAPASLARLAEVERDPASAHRSRVSILLGNSATPQTQSVTHTLWAMLGVLPVGRVQRPHRHQSVALDLITDCAPGCYSLLGAHLDDQGAIIDPVRVDWEPAGAFVTPPGLWHSHHNESGRPAHLVPIQDAGLHTYLRSLDIRFTTAGA
jgi:gentisate 1,2-dioxygenase